MFDKALSTGKAGQKFSTPTSQLPSPQKKGFPEKKIKDISKTDLN